MDVTGLFVHCSAIDKQKNKREYVKMGEKILRRIAEDSKKENVEEENV